MTNRNDEGAGSTLETTWELELNSVTDARFARLVVERELEHIAGDSWATERMTLEGLFDYALTTSRDRTERAAVLDLATVVEDDCLVHISLIRGHMYLRVAARTVDTLTAAKAWLRDRYPVTAPEEAKRAAVTFWSLAKYARQFTRLVDVPAWDDVSSNYPGRVVRDLGPLMSDSYRPQHGQLLLWHGEPGTGKTYALRALAWEWRAWCRFHYVTDPERFFGENAGYMLDVILDESDDEEGEESWRLLICEDTGELLAADAKERAGQGLSRLLNVVDGLIGQGLRLVVLVTTNEQLRRLHPAVSRPGRCAAHVEFGPFDEDEARRWLRRRGSDAEPRAGTLAFLYALEAGVEVAERQAIGFTR